MGKVCYTDHDFSLDPLVSDPVFFHSLCSVKQCECVSHLVLEHYMDQQVRYLVFLIRNSMCTGKIYVSDIFTQISDSSGHMVWSKFDEYLRELLALPTAIFEGPSFGYTESVSRSCFDVVSLFSQVL